MEHGNMELDMEVVFNIGLMEAFMKVTGMMAWPMEKED